MADNRIDVMWDDNPIDVTAEANFIWSIANKLRGSYMPDKYGDVIIPFTILRRFECTLEPTKKAVVEAFEKDTSVPEKSLKKTSGYQFYNTSRFTLKELCNDPDHIAENMISYINGFSANVQDIMKELEMGTHIKKMNKDGCLYSVVKAFSELDLNPATFDSIKMGYIFENLIGRFYQNVDAGQFYTGRDIIKMLVSVLISEGCDDIFDDHKIITVCDQACGTGGMLSTAFSYLKHYNPTADVRLFGQEFMGQSYAVGLAEMLIKGQNADNFRHADTFKEDCFKNTKMRFVIENPPFGTPWSGADAKEGQEAAVKEEYAKGKSGRWGAGLPSGGDSQMLFLQSAIDKLDKTRGRAAIISNGSPLYTGGTASGESQIRRWLLENDYLEAIIAMPTDLFYNTALQTFVWILSMNKEPKRQGKVQLIDASSIFHRLRKPLGNKKNEFLPEDRKAITDLYLNFEENELCQIYDNQDFMYREYTVMQPLQRSYTITKERIEAMRAKGSLSSLYDEVAFADLALLENRTDKEDKQYNKFFIGKPIYEAIMEALNSNVSSEKYLSPEAFIPVLTKILANATQDKKLIEKIADGLSEMDKTAEIQKDKKGNILYDKETKDTELVPYKTDIEDYMKTEVLPYVPDAQWFFEEKLTAKKPVIKIGAEIPFTRNFYKFQEQLPSEELEEQFLAFERQKKPVISEQEKQPIEKDIELIPSGVEWIGDIPNDWEISNIGGMYSVRTQKVSDVDYPPLSVTKQGVLPQLENVAKTNAHDDRKLVKKGDFAINSRSDRRGSCGVSEFDGSVSLINTVLMPREQMHSGYYNWLFHTIQFADEFYRNGHGIVDDLWTTNWQDMKKIRVPSPTLEEQEQIAAFLDERCSEIDAAIEEKKKQLETLEQYKKSLIFEYVTGKKQVKGED